jgi:hypothetical protein
MASPFPYGFVSPLKYHLSTLATVNYPGMKISPLNFVKALLENKPPINIASINGSSPLSLNAQSGQIREAKVKYLQRRTDDDVSDTDECGTTFIHKYLEQSIEAPRFAQAGFFIDLPTLKRYEDAAMQLVQTGNPNVPVLQEVWTQIMHTVNAVLSKIDAALISDVTFGVNVTTGNNSPKTLNINKLGNMYDLTNGLLELANDYQENEFSGTAIIVGNGLFNRFANARAATGVNAGGINVASVFDYKWYFDIKTTSGWGANQIGVFAPGTIGLVDFDNYMTFPRDRFGTSQFTILPLPLETSTGEVVTMNFNVQIKEVDCPSTQLDTPYGTTAAGRGMEVYISKNFGLWQLPTDAYAAGDRLAGVNGALNYDVTNDCVEC